MYSFIGRTIFFVGKPLLKLLIRRSRRSYVLLLHQEKVVVVKGFISSGKWHLPGGGCKKGESYVDAAVRELKEETGVSVSPELLQPLSQKILYSKEFGHTYMVYSVGLSSLTELHYQRYELIGARWIEQSGLNESNSGKEVMVALNRSHSI